MRLLFISVLLLVSFFSSASSMLKKNEALVFSCDLGNNERLLTYFNHIDKTMYFLVSGDERQVVYQPQSGRELDNYQWVRISERDPEYVPLRFEIDDIHNAYFAMTKGGIRLQIMDAKLLFEDGNAIYYNCIEGTDKGFDIHVFHQIKTVEPNKFEAWD